MILTHTARRADKALVTDSFRHSAEGRRALDPAHGARHGDAHELRLVAVVREDHTEPEAVQDTQEEAAEAVLEVVFGSSNGTKLGIRVSDMTQHPGKCASKLHGFRGCVSHCRFVHGWPAPVP